MLVNFKYHLGDNELEVTCDITGGSPGRYSGPPEDCYPAEDPDVEIESVTLNGHDFHTADIELRQHNRAVDLDDLICEAALEQVL